MGLSDGRKSFPIGLAVLIQYRSVTDTQPRCRSYYAQRSGVEPKNGNYSNIQKKTAEDRQTMVRDKMKTSHTSNYRLIHSSTQCNNYLATAAIDLLLVVLKYLCQTKVCDLHLFQTFNYNIKTHSSDSVLTARRTALPDHASCCSQCGIWHVLWQLSIHPSVCHSNALHPNSSI